MRIKDRNFLAMIEIQEKFFRRIFMIESNNQSRIINLYRSAFERKRVLNLLKMIEKE